MHKAQGKAVSGLDHLRQSVADILLTPIGSRLQRRTYGSLLADLIDHPDSPATRIRMYSAAAGALMRWEPRLRVSRVVLSSGPAPGQATLEIAGTYVQGGRGRPVDLSVPLRMGATV